MVSSGLEDSLLVVLIAGCGLGTVDGSGAGAAKACGGGAGKTGGALREKSCGILLRLGLDVTTGCHWPASDLASLISAELMRVSSTPISCREPSRNSSTR